MRVRNPHVVGQLHREAASMTFEASWGKCGWLVHLAAQAAGKGKGACRDNPSISPNHAPIRLGRHTA